MNTGPVRPVCFSLSDRPQCTAARRRCSAAAAAAAATTNGPASALRLLLIGEHPHLYGVCKVHSNCHVTGVPAAARAGGCGPRCTADRVPRRPRHRWRPVAVRRRLRLRTVENVGWRLGPAGEAGRGTDCRCDFVARFTRVADAVQSGTALIGPGADCHSMSCCLVPDLVGTRRKRQTST